MAKKGSLKKAEPKISELFWHNPGNHVVQYAMGVIRMMKGDFVKALSCFDQSLTIKPDFVKAWYQKAIVYQHTKEISKMIAAYRQVVEKGRAIDPLVRHSLNALKEFAHNVRVKYKLGIDEYLEYIDKFSTSLTLMKQENWQESADKLKEAVTVNSYAPQVFSNLGICLTKLGRISEAMEAFDSALKIDPEYKPAINNKIFISSMHEGEKPESRIHSVDFEK